MIRSVAQTGGAYLKSWGCADGSSHIGAPRWISVRQSMNDLFRHRGGAIVVAVVLSIAGWAIVGGLAYFLWNLFWAQPSQQNDGRGGGDLVVAVCEAAAPPG